MNFTVPSAPGRPIHQDDLRDPTDTPWSLFQPLDLQRSYRHEAFTYQLAGHVGLVLLAIGTAVAFSTPSALVTAGPSVFILLVTALSSRLPVPAVSAAVDRPRALEGDTVKVSVTISVDRPAAVVDVELFPPRDVERCAPLRKVLSLAAGETQTVEFEIVLTTWGINQLGHLTVGVKDRFGIQSQLNRFRISSSLRVHVREEKVGSLTEPPRFRNLVGSHLSPDRGDGCEIADVRPYQPGDRIRNINWRISARNDEPWITLRHPDRSATVVVMVDAFSLAGSSRQDALRRSVRGALGLARLHLNAQDPIGLLIVGHGIRWFPPNLGARHLAAMTDGLLDLSTSTWADGTIGRHHIERLVPREAVIVAISPLMSETFIESIQRLRGRGHPVNIIEPHTHWPSHDGGLKGYGSGSVPVGNVAWQIFQLQGQVVRSKLADMGCNVVPWKQEDPLGLVLRELHLRQHARGRP